MRLIVQESSEDVLTQRFDVCMELAECHADLSDVGAAERYYREAAALCPGRPEPHAGLGMLCVQMDQTDEARAHFERALACDGAYPDALTGLAGLRLKAREYDAAFDGYIRALEADPNHLVALLGLFRASCLMGSFAKVIQYLEHFLCLHPGDTSVMFCLATLYVKEGRAADAGEMLERLLALDPANGEAQTLYWQVTDARRRTPAEVS